MNATPPTVLAGSSVSYAGFFVKETKSATMNIFRIFLFSF